MKVFAAASALAMLAAPAMAADATTSARPFDIKDLVMMQRVGSPQLSPDGRYALYSLRSTDYAANKGVTAVYVQDLQEQGAPRQLLDKGRDPRWAPDGRSIYYIAPAKEVNQLWRLDLIKGQQGLELGHLGTPRQLSHSTLELGGYRLSPDGQQVLLSYEVYRDCQTLACTQARLDERAQSKASGTVYHKLFVRHWDTWANGRRNQLFITDVTHPA